MENVKNSILLEATIKAVYNVASRRTSVKFADETIGSSIKTLERKFDFLKYVNVSPRNTSDGNLEVSVSPDIDIISSDEVGKAIEALVRVVYNDMSGDAGLYFITEFKESAGEEITRKITDCDVDLDQVQLEQHYAFRRRERKKSIAEAVKRGTLSKKQPENLLGYTWGNVSHWKHDPGSKYCTLFDKEGNVVDRLNLDRIIQNYVERLSGYVDVDTREIEKETKIYEKEYELLQLLLERDMDADTAMHMLKLSREELNNIIRKLSQMEMLQYVSYDTIELTDVGIGYISKKGPKKK
jgi:hypothetical protein